MASKNYFIKHLFNYKKNHEVYTLHSINLNFECDPQVEKGWVRLVHRVHRSDIVYLANIF